MVTNECRVIYSQEVTCVVENRTEAVIVSLLASVALVKYSEVQIGTLYDIWHSKGKNIKLLP